MGRISAFPKGTNLFTVLAALVVEEDKRALGVLNMAIRAEPLGFVLISVRCRRT
jgi:hypothetical protein